MNLHVSNMQVQPDATSREQVADLLERYPHLSQQEVRQILSFLQTARHLDVGLLTASDRLKPKLDAFMNDHRAHFRVGLGEAAGVIAVIVAVLAILWLVWEAFA